MARQRFCGVRCRRDWDNMRGQAERELARLEREAEAEAERLRDLARERIHAGAFSAVGLFSTDDLYGWNAGMQGEPGGWPWPLWTHDPWSLDEPDAPGAEGITANALVDAVPM